MGRSGGHRWGVSVTAYGENLMAAVRSLALVLEHQGDRALPDLLGVPLGL